MLFYSMNINIRYWSKMTAQEKASLLRRSEEGIDDVRESVTSIINEVKKNGDSALINFTNQFDHVDLTNIPLQITSHEFEQAEATLSLELKEAIDFAIGNIKTFHKRQTVEDLPLKEITPGIWAGEKAVPIDSLGIYVPNGRGNFPSMLYMAAIPAVEAGVKRIAVASPPNQEGSVDPATLYAAKQCGITEVYRIGGAQAIAALAHGTESIRPCAMLTGPGSRYVTAAKRVLFGTVDVGLPAGPSESIVLADSSADPYILTLDLLTEAEHGSDSSALLITDSKELAEAVKKEIEKQTLTLGAERQKFVMDVMSGYGGIIITETIAEAVELTNIIATEHLQIVTVDPEKTAELIRNAGEILLGPTPFVAANYAIGPNAILPTGGNARTFSAVSVRDFIKYSSIIKTDERGLESLKRPVSILTQYEGFETHYNAIAKRDKK